MRADRKLSMMRLMLELIEESIVLVFLELKLGLAEIRGNIRTAEKGGAMMAIGGSLLVLSLIAFIATAIIALDIVLPLWLSALIVAAGLGFLGTAFFFSGLGNLKHFSLVPKDTMHRVDVIANKLKEHTERHRKQAREELQEAREELRQAARDKAAREAPIARARRRFTAAGASKLEEEAAKHTRAA